MRFLPLTKDVVFKAYFEDKEALIPLLQHFLPLPKGSIITEVDIQNSEQTSGPLKGVDSEFKKLFVLDLIVFFEREINGEKIVGERANVELQSSAHANFSDRVVVYSSRLLSNQLDEGQNYSELKRVYSLVFCGNNLKEFNKSPKDKYLHICRIQDIDPPHAVFSDSMQFIIVELKKFNKKIKELNDRQQDWCFILKNSAKLTEKEYIALERKGADMAKALKRLKDISQDEKMRNYLDQIDKAKRDQLTREYEAKAEARAEGRAEGRAEENRKRTREIALNMLKSKLDESLISQVTGLTKEEIQKLAKNL